MGANIREHLFLISLILLNVFVNLTWSYRILAIFPHTGKSHHIVFEPLLRALAEKGNELVVISHYPLKDAPSTYEDVSLAGSMHLNVHICDFDDFMFISGIGSVIRHIMATYELFDLGNLNCNAMSNHKNVDQLIKANKTFDVILTEQFNSDCAFGIINKYKAPVVGIATHIPMPWTRSRFGLSDNPSYVPSHFLKYCRNPSFLQSVEAVMVNTYYKFVYYLNTHVLEYRFLGKGFLESRNDIDVIADTRLSLLMVTTYFPLHGAFPQGPNVVDIGGVHLPSKLNTLPPDLQKFLDESESGVIFFSMGSMIRGKSLPPQKLKAFQDAFSQLPHRVLWKWENETMQGKSDNIMISKWLPQFEIMNHKKVVAFIGHGGLLGLTEAVHCGVPVIVVPLFGDQFANGAAAEESGLGRVLPYEEITAETVLETLKDVLSPQMKISASRLSSVWRDRPMSPLDSAVYWVEHVARHGGAHLRPAHAALPLHRYLLLDVAAFLLLLALLACYISYTLIKMTLRLLCRKNKKIKTQ